MSRCGTPAVMWYGGGGHVDCAVAFLWFPALVLATMLIIWQRPATASEFPERECCDLEYPLPAPPSSTAAVTTVPTSGPGGLGGTLVTTPSGPNITSTIAILNCLLARQLCFEDASCSSILEIIPRVCGPELVACSTVTVTKCQAALRTLQAFPFFKPTCLCREPHVDPECNSFRDFLFDHPCVFVLKKEKDPYPVDALPTCNHALSVCQLERKCIKLYDDFKTNCKVRDNKCRMEDRDLCHESWSNLRRSPMFGCICPNNHMKKRCDRIFSMVNHNPCVDHSNDVLYDLEHSSHPIATTPYPYDAALDFLTNYRWSWSMPLVTPSPVPIYLPLTTRKYTSVDLSEAPTKSPIRHYGTHTTSNGTINRTHLHHHRHHHHHHERTGTSPQLSYSSPSLEDNNSTTTTTATTTMATFHLQFHHAGGAGGTYSVDNALSASSSSSAASSFDYGLGSNAIVENPLIDAANGMEAHADNDHISVNVLKNKGRSSASSPSSVAAFVPNISQYEDEPEGNGMWSITVNKSASASDIHRQQNTSSTSNSHHHNGHTDIARTIFKSTCHVAMESCNNNYNCRMSLAPILHHCDPSHCGRNNCMEALQGFYRKPNFHWNVEIAFCLCKKTDIRPDSCMVAQEKLHPICAQRIDGSPQPTCLSLAETCREIKECRARLEFYEQSCSVDSVTKKCAGSPSECRHAMLGILGTDLRTTCACKGTDMSQLYECLGWQRLLWVNPCVVESQKDFHMKKAEQLALLSTTSTSTSTTTTSTTTTRPITTTPLVTVQIPTETSLLTHLNQENKAPRVLLTPSSSSTSTSTSTSSTTSSTTSTTTSTTTTTTTTTQATTTLPPRYCVVQRPQFPDQYIKEGTFKRIYHEEEFECSDVCECEVGEKLACKTICIDRMPCKTEFAHYNHAAPAYQAYRGRCLCYSGRFICMKPAPSEYSLPQGIFLFLGYSEVDEHELNKNHTKVVIQDVVRALQEVIIQEAINGTMCLLELYNTTRENVIVVGKLADVDYTMLSPIESLSREKEECAELLETVSDRINNRNPDFISHLLLSVFKMAEVEIVQVDRSGSLKTQPLRANLLIICFLFLALTAARNYYIHIAIALQS